MRDHLKIRLSTLMFLHYFSAGITLPIMSLYLSQELGFGGTGAGIILAVSAVSAFVAPLFGAFVTDRLISAERLFSLVEFGAGAFIFLMWTSETFTAVLVFYVLYMSMLIPAMALSNTIVFHYMPEAGNSFGGVRLWGTVGWVVAGWAFGYFWIGYAGGRVIDAPLFTAISAGGLGLFALTLPRGRGQEPRRTELVPRAALRIFRRPEVALVAVVALLMQVTHRVYYFGAAPYLRHLGFSDGAILPALSLGQVAEVLSMLVLPFLFLRFRHRTVLVMGAVMELCRFAAFYFGTSALPAILGILFHGPSYTFFFIVSVIYVNSFADTESRAGVQQLYILCVEGGGALGGSFLAGMLYDLFTRGDLVEYRYFWGVPFFMALVSIGLLIHLNLHARQKAEPR